MPEVTYEQLVDPADRRPVHFVGIAGAGMSALAELFARRGAAVNSSIPSSSSAGGGSCEAKGSRT